MELMVVLAGLMTMMTTSLVLQRLSYRKIEVAVK